MALTDHIVPDSPTNNFATMNPLDKGSSVTISNGNLFVSTTSNLPEFTITRSNIVFPKTGLYYFECHFLSSSNGGWFGIDNGYSNISGNQNGSNNGTASIGRDGNSNFFLIIDSISIGNETHTSGTVIPVVWDADTNTIYTNHGAPSSSSLGSYTYSGVISSVTGDFFPIAGPRYTTTDFTFNFGQDPTFGGAKSPTTTYTDANGIGSFYYQPPTGALALCTANLPDLTPTVTGDVPQDYFKAVTYSGSIGNDQLVDCGFPADFIWIKGKTATFNTAHLLYDTVRGRTSVLSSNNTDAEYDYSTNSSGDLAPTFSTASNSINGFKTPPVANNNINHSGSTYVTWFFRAGGPPSGSTSTTGSAKRINTSGTQDDTSCSALATAATNAGASNVITPTLMSINQAAGFSIVKYQGASASNSGLPHGLTQAPEMVIIKNLDDTKSWVVGNDYLTNWGYTLGLNLTSDEFTSAGSFDSTAPTSSIITLGNSFGANNSSYNYIAYCWHSVENYSKCGSYTGNGLPDGPFVYCGFRPAFVMVKCTSTSSTMWIMFDSEREKYNVMDSYLQANDSLAEASYPFIDFLSNGFKHRHNSSHTNATNNTYIYMAFAEQPFKFSNAR